MMSVLSRLLLLACVLSTSVAALKSRNVFDVTLNIAAPLPPLNITGGAFLVAPIDNGTIHGDFEARILSGIATVQVFDSGFTQVITITVFGLDDENNTFFINEMGIRTNATQQITRAQFQTGGKYAYFTESFLVATSDPRLQDETMARSVNVKVFSLEYS